MVSCTFPHPYASNKALEGKKKQYKILTPKFPTPPYKAIVLREASVQFTSVVKPRVQKLATSGDPTDSDDNRYYWQGADTERRKIVREKCAWVHTSPFNSIHRFLLKGWLAIASLKPTFTFLVGILPSKSIEYGKIPTKKSESWF